MVRQIGLNCGANRTPGNDEVLRCREIAEQERVLSENFKGGGGMDGVGFGHSSSLD